MGPGQKFVTQVALGQFFVAQVGSTIFGLDLENFPYKSQIFQFFSRRVKKKCFESGQKVPGSKPGWPLIYCRSKVCSGHL